jgi:tRNA nucleotidyltransferase (CCA-adding enzyme)
MPGSIEKDLFRRDFSINAMAISLAAKGYGELLDPYHGKDDLDLRLIRILHPASFSDDATRILRAIRYEQRLGFELETETSRRLKQAIPLLDTISGDRIRHELELIFREEEPERALRRLGELGALQRLSPSLKGNDWLADKLAIARRSSKSGELPALYFCLLVYPLDEKEVSQLVRRLNMPARLAKTVEDAIRLKLCLPRLDKPHLKPSRVYQFLREYHPLAVKANAIAGDNAATRQYLELFLSRLRYIKPRLNGEELQRLGIPEGAELGRILRSLHQARLDGEVSTRDDEEKLALKLKPR